MIRYKKQKTIQLAKASVFTLLIYIKLRKSNLQRSACLPTMPYASVRERKRERESGRGRVGEGEDCVSVRQLCGEGSSVEDAGQNEGLNFLNETVYFT